MAEIKNDVNHNSNDGGNSDLSGSINTLKEQIKYLETEQIEMDAAVKELIDTLIKAAFAPGEAVSKIMEELRRALLNQPLIGVHHLIPFTQKLRQSLNLEVSSTTGQAKAGPVLSAQQSKDLCELIDAIISIKSGRYTDHGQMLCEMANAGQGWAVIIPRLTDLVFQIKEDVWEERRRAIKQISGILSDLEGAEKEFINSLTVSQEYLNGTTANFNDEMEHGIADIAALAVPGTNNMDKLLDALVNKVTGLRATIHQKKVTDASQLSQLTQRKDAAEHRLDSIHRDYEEFSRQSREMLHEIEELKAISLNDPLTCTYNRRAYDRQIEKTVDDFRNKSLRTASIIVFDVDLFRGINNNYGHLVGDHILRYVAKLTKESLRTDDFLFRYGGDEFVILLPNTGLDAATAVAEKIRRTIANIEFKLSKNSDKTVQVTISMGATELRDHDSMEALFSRADKALYQSKDSGRNRVSSL